LLQGVSPQPGNRNIRGLGQAAHVSGITHLLLNQELFAPVLIGLEDKEAWPLTEYQSTKLDGCKLGAVTFVDWMKGRNRQIAGIPRATANTGSGPAADVRKITVYVR